MSQGRTKIDRVGRGTPPVSVVVATFERPAEVKRALAAILACQPVADEVIVVDQSRDLRTKRALAQIVRSGAVRYVRTDSAGAAAARNIGWRVAKHELVAFTDDDAAVESDWVGAIKAAALRNPDFGVLGGAVIAGVLERQAEFIRSLGRWRYLLPELDLGSVERAFPGNTLPIGVNCCIRRGALETFGGFDEELGPNWRTGGKLYGEETVLFLRMRQRELPLMYVPDMRVIHPVTEERVRREYWERRLHTEGASMAAWSTMAGLRGYARGGARLLYHCMRWLLEKAQGRETFFTAAYVRGILDFLRGRVGNADEKQK